MLTLQNPVRHAVSSTISSNTLKVRNAGQSLSTGKKADINVVDQFLGNALSDTSSYLSSVIGSMSYSQNALKIASSGVNSMGETASEMLALIAQATGQSAENRASLDKILTDKKTQIGQQLSNATFDGRKLLDGSLGQNATITAKYPNVTVADAVSTSTLLATTGGAATAVTTITAASIGVGDTFSLEGVVFKAVAKGTTPNLAKNEFAICDTDALTASSLVTTMRNCSDTKLLHYSFSLSSNVITITQNSQGATFTTDGKIQCASLNAAGSAVSSGISQPTGGTLTAAGSYGVSLAHINNMPSLIGQLSATVTCIDNSTGVSALALAKRYGYDPLLGPVPAASATANDNAFIFRVDMGGRSFTGALFVDDTTQANQDLDGRVIKFIDDSTGEYFTLTAAGTANTSPAVWANSASPTTLASNIAGMINSTTVYQTRDLDINVSNGPISYKGVTVADTTGMTAKLTHENFTNKVFESFAITANSSTTSDFTAVISGETYSNTGVTIANLIQGASVTLTSTSNTAHKLTINLGKSGLTAISANTYDLVSNVFQNAFFNAGSGLKVRIGENFTDNTLVKIGNLSKEKLFIQSNGSYLEKLSVLTDDDAKAAEAAIRNALKLIRTEQANIATQSESLENVKKSLINSQAVTVEAASQYLDSDLVDESAKFSQSLKSIQSSIQVFQASNQISDAATQIIRSLG